MENTKENKAKFFALYYGQNVMANVNNPYTKEITVERLFISNNRLDGYFLYLVPLLKINEVDAKVIHMEDLLLKLEHVDYLRSKGYAVPYMGMSIDKLVEYGWVKLNYHG